MKQNIINVLAKDKKEFLKIIKTGLFDSKNGDFKLLFSGFQVFIFDVSKACNNYFTT